MLSKVNEKLREMTEDEKTILIKGKNNSVLTTNMFQLGSIKTGKKIKRNNNGTQSPDVIKAHPHLNVKVHSLESKIYFVYIKIIKL